MLYLRGDAVFVLKSAAQLPWRGSLAPGSLCSVPCRALRPWWCARRCPRDVAGSQGGLAW